MLQDDVDTTIFCYACVCRFRNKIFQDNKYLGMLEIRPFKYIQIMHLCALNIENIEK